MRLYLDFETRSQINLKKSGAYHYAEDHSTEPLCAAWQCLEDGDKRPEIKPCLWLPGESAGEPGFVRLLREGATLIAHNSTFERLILHHKFNFDVPLTQISDTAARAARYSFPRRLEQLMPALKLEQQKDMDGHRIMLKLSKPRQGSGAFNEGEDDQYWTPETKPDDFQRLYGYCKDDVVAMRVADLVLPELDEWSQRTWLMTERMNDRGIAVDPMLATAREVAARAQADLAARFTEIVGFGPSSPKATEALGMESLDKQHVRDALKTAEGWKKDALLLRKSFAKTSVKKLDAFLAQINFDGRLRGSLAFCGAERTGRFAGRGVQPQNFPRGLGKKQDDAFEALRLGVLADCYVDVVDTLSGMMRGFFVDGG